MPARRFPPPWTIDDNGSCFIIRDQNGQALAYAYYENEPGRRPAANLMTRDEARCIASNIAKQEAKPPLIQGGSGVAEFPPDASIPGTMRAKEGDRSRPAAY